MKANKKLTDKALLFQRLKERWSRLPSNMVYQIVIGSEVNEKGLDNLRTESLNNYIKEQRRAYERKKNTNG